ncbi:MAG: sulfite exporter TauE/SafE family protein [Candidatus Gastranaerophilales bacterium]|nr:sulfite exporter TauE/SafE family protein [Candidatus Gastranaerophilales bacterium]
MNIPIQIIAGFLSGLISSMGFGGGGVLIIYLIVFLDTPQLKAQGINLLFFIPCAILATIIYTIKKQINYKEILPVILGGFVGSISSSFLLKSINSSYLPKIFAIFLIVMGFLSILRLKGNKKDDRINLS